MPADYYNDMRIVIEEGSHYKVEVVADTKSTEHGSRITTMALTYPRYIHAQMLTHRVFSRNAQSSRAVPTRILLERVSRDPVMPLRWGKNQPGMVAGDLLEDPALAYARAEWRVQADRAVSSAKAMSELGVHKEVTNRVLEPFSTITAIYTATEWHNFFKLRCEEDAQPEIQLLSNMMADALGDSDPVTSRHHLPYITSEEYSPVSLRDMFKISAARCARVSYLTHEGEHDIVKDMDLADRLASSGHWSPWEHPALSDMAPLMSANFRGWSSARKLRGE